MYKVLWDDTIADDLKKIDKIIARKIISKVSSYLARDPVNLGKPLTGNLAGLMSYRFGDYRVIYEVQEKNITIFVVKISHRKEAYS